MTAKRKCIECGRLLEDWEDDICDECKEEMNNFASAVLSCDDIPPNF